VAGQGDWPIARSRAPVSGVHRSAARRPLTKEADGPGAGFGREGHLRLMKLCDDVKVPPLDSTLPTAEARLVEIRIF
jgi:hypothetical protein